MWELCKLYIKFCNKIEIRLSIFVLHKKCIIKFLRLKAKETEPTKQPKNIDPAKNTTPFPIIGIGASAGGLEALEKLLGSVPNDSGMAYVVIQHLDPTKKGMLPELLQRISKMEVLLAENTMQRCNLTAYMLFLITRVCQF